MSKSPVIEKVLSIPSDDKGLYKVTLRFSSGETVDSYLTKEEYKYKMFKQELINKGYDEEDLNKLLESFLEVLLTLK